jgi:hypothetical protein
MELVSSSENMCLLNRVSIFTYCVRIKLLAIQVSHFFLNIKYQVQIECGVKKINRHFIMKYGVMEIVLRIIKLRSRCR